MTHMPQFQARFSLCAAALIAASLVSCHPTKGARAGASGAAEGSDETVAGADALLVHLPPRCEVGRVFVDWRGLTHHAAFKGHLPALEEKAAEAMRGDMGEGVEAALRAFRKQGLDPARDIGEVAMCIRTERNPILAFSVDLHGHDFWRVLDAISKQYGATQKLATKVVDGVRYFEADGSFLAQVAPEIIVLDVKGEVGDLAALADREGVAKGWQAAQGALVWAHVVTERGAVDLSLNAEGSDLVLEARVASPEVGRDRFTQKEIRRGLDDLARQLAATPFQPLADDIRHMTITKDGDAVRGKLIAPSAHVSAAIERILAATEEELERSF